ncbi:unannotated protein [freshwater metagenome]|uniref:Unannotated protein n=1 Tax=freshwater metagenome TaxID=449393 RepID=A0A6J7R7C6_9ZZZZ
MNFFGIAISNFAPNWSTPEHSWVLRALYLVAAATSLHVIPSALAADGIATASAATMVAVVRAAKLFFRVLFIMSLLVPHS